jgi:hypothetical protein
MKMEIMVYMVQQYYSLNPIWRTEDRVLKWHNWLGKTFSNWETIKSGVNPGFSLGSVVTFTAY